MHYDEMFQVSCASIAYCYDFCKVLYRIYIVLESFFIFLYIFWFYFLDMIYRIHAYTCVTQTHIHVYIIYMHNIYIYIYIMNVVIEVVQICDTMK